MIALILVLIMASKAYPNKPKDQLIKEAEEIHKLMKQRDFRDGKVYSLVNRKEVKDRH